MIARRLLKVGFSLLCCGSASLLRAGPTDGFFIPSTPDDSGRESLPYDSEYAAAAREFGFSGSPESDARPGQYYFLEAVHAVRKKDYAFAIQMYEVAASWAYKPAEYNLGVIYARGEGVPVDLPRAMAWMALAAERNEPRYVEARETVYAYLTKEQFEQANVIWRELKKTFGDDVALRRAKARWAEVRSHMTGSRVGFAGNLSVGGAAPSGGVTQGPKLLGGVAEAAQRGNEGKGTMANPAPQGFTGITSAAEVTGGEGVDGTIAYRQLRESKDPYDPKFDQRALGRATVGAPQPVKGSAPKANDANKDAKKQDTSEQDAKKQDASEQDRQEH